MDDLQDKEDEADYFAYELLLPEHLMIRAIKVTDRLNILSNIFNIKERHILKRMKNLKLLKK